MTSPTTEDVPRVGDKFTVLRKTAEGRSVVCVAPATSVTKRGSYYFCTIGNCEFWLSNRFGGVLHHAPRDHRYGGRFGVDVRRYAGEDDDRALADYQDRKRLTTALQDAKTWPHEKVLRVLAALDDTLYAAHQEELAKLRAELEQAAALGRAGL